MDNGTRPGTGSPRPSAEPRLFLPKRSKRSARNSATTSTECSTSCVRCRTATAALPGHHGPCCRRYRSHPDRGGGVASFYSFLSLAPKGRVTIRLCDDIVTGSPGCQRSPVFLKRSLGSKSAKPATMVRFRWNTLPASACAIRRQRDGQRHRPDETDAGDRAQRRAGAEGGPKPGAVDQRKFEALTPSERALHMVDNNIRHAGEVLLGPVPEDAGLAKAATITRRRSSPRSRKAGCAAVAVQALPPAASGGSRPVNVRDALRHLQCR